MVSTFKFLCEHIDNLGGYNYEDNSISWTKEVIIIKDKFQKLYPLETLFQDCFSKKKQQSLLKTNIVTIFQTMYCQQKGITRYTFQESVFKDKTSSGISISFQKPTNKLLKA